MREAYKVICPEMPSELLSVETNNVEWVIKLYVQEKRNTIETLSVDVQMQQLCMGTMDRFHKKALRLKINNIKEYS